MIYDHFRVTGAHNTVLDYADLFSVTLRRDNIQEFDSRWDEVLPSCQRFHPMTSWKVCTHCGYVSLINSKLFWNCTTWRFIRRYRCIVKRLIVFFCLKEFLQVFLLSLCMSGCGTMGLWTFVGRRTLHRTRVSVYKLF